jgi:hypothetical protein
VDPSGRPVVRVEMSNLPNVFATVDAADYDRLLAEGVSARWFINSNGKGTSYVRVSVNGVRGNLVLPARLILDAGRGEAVRYATPDRLDLRRSNISVVKGWAKKRSHTPVQAEALYAL